MLIAPKEIQKVMQNKYGSSPSGSVTPNSSGVKKDTKKESAKLKAHKQNKKQQAKKIEQESLVLTGKRNRKPSKLYIGSDSDEELRALDPKKKG